MNVIPDTIDFNKYLGFKEAANVKKASDYAQTVVDRFYRETSDPGLTLPWTKTHGNVVLRPGKVSLWTGITHHGKTTVLKNVMNHAMTMGEKVCFCSMEEEIPEALEDMTRQAAGNAEPGIMFIKSYHRWLDGKLWYYDQFGVVDAQRIVAVMAYVTKELGVTQFVIDSLMKTSVRGDDYDGQRIFVNQLGAYAKAYGCHVHLVAHGRKQGDEDTPMNVFDVKGSGDIISQVDNIFNVFRVKKKKTPEDADCFLKVEKQRGQTNWIGSIALHYHAASRQYLEFRGAKPQSFFEFNREIAA